MVESAENLQGRIGGSTVTDDVLKLCTAGGYCRLFENGADGFGDEPFGIEAGCDDRNASRRHRHIRDGTPAAGVQIADSENKP
jgi:hypothetical protein